MSGSRHEGQEVKYRKYIPGAYPGGFVYKPPLFSAMRKMYN